MSLRKPPPNWWAPLDLQEKVWMGIALLWCLIMFAMMVAWAAFGKQNPPEETWRIDPDEYGRRTAEYVQKFQKKDEKGRLAYEGGVPIVVASETEDNYLQGRTWAWEPILVMEKGKTYRLRISSLDLQHGFSLQPTNLNLQILPGYEYVAALTPTEKGEFLIVCNEFCGEGHHKMVGKIYVESLEE